MEEIWKDVVGYEGLYQVSNLGRVKSMERYVHKNSGGRIKNAYNAHIREKVLTNTKNSKNYLTVTLSKDKTPDIFFVHRLMAMAFLPNPYNLSDVNHKDENPSNNFIYINEDGSVDYEKSNLEWCTHKYNCNYGTSKFRIIKTRRKNNDVSEMVKKQKETKKRLKSRCRPLPVAQYKMDGELVATYESALQASKITGIHVSAILRCCHGTYKQMRGFIWKFIEE